MLSVRDMAGDGVETESVLTVVVLEAAGIAFAIPAWAVMHITVPVPVTPLPLVPNYVDGLVGLNDRILPQIDLRRRLALPAAALDGPGNLLAVMADEGGYALRVDRVVTLTSVAAESIQVFGQALDGSESREGTGDAKPQGWGTGLVVGEFSWRPGQTAFLLHPDRLGLRELVTRDGASENDRERAVPGRGSGGIPVPSLPISDEPDYVYVVARHGAELFAVPVTRVVEVVAIEIVAAPPGAPATVVGLTHLRGRAVPVLALAEKAGNATEGEAKVRMLMVFDTGHTQFAVQVDAVLGVRHFPQSRIHVNTETGSRGGHTGYVIDANERVIGLLDVDRLATVGGWEAAPSPPDVSAVARREATRQVLLFRVGSEWYGLDVAGVAKVTPHRALAPVPALANGSASDSALAGLVEIGAEVLPAIDLRIVMAVPTTVDEWTALVVVASDDGRWAMVVDRIDRLATVPVSLFQPAEATAHSLVTHVFCVDHRLVSLLELSPLFGF
jgi:chemotaxis signal transduction protein